MNMIIFLKVNRKKCNIFFSPQGAVVYAHFGEESDLSLLQDKNINLNGRVVLVRAGKISFAEKVGGLVWAIYNITNFTLIFLLSPANVYDFFIWQQ